MAGHGYSREFVELQTAVAGKYTLERELGRGGMGIVFLARDVGLDRPVALKLLPPHLAAQSGFKDRFLSEARLAARLSHPNIVTIHAVEEHDDLVFFVMAYIRGETLTQRVERTGPLSAPPAPPRPPGGRPGPPACSRRSRGGWATPTPTASSTGTSSRTTS